MIASDWGRWLIDAVETADVAGLSVWYLGCNGLVVKAADGTVLYVDPYLGTGDPPRTVRMIPVPFEPDAPAVADAVLVTHEHTDHLHGPSQGPLLAGTGASLVADPGCLDLVRERGWLDEHALDEDQLVAAVPGETLAVGGLSLSVYPGTDPDADHGVTYVLEYEGHTVVHPGDGRPDGVLEDIGRDHDVDLAVVAVGSAGMIPDKRTREPTYTRWYNGPDECVRAAAQLGADVLVPTHWDMWKGMTTDPTTIDAHRRSFSPPNRVAVLEIGDRYDC